MRAAGALALLAFAGGCARGGEDLHARGVAALEAGRTWEGLWQLSLALHREPDHPGALSRLGLAAYVDHRPDDALAHLERLAALRPLGWDESVALADASVLRSRVARAESVFGDALARFPDAAAESRARAFEGLGDARARQGRTEDALAAYAEARALNPGKVTVALKESSLLAKGGQAARAREALPRLTFGSAGRQGVLGDWVVLTHRLALPQASREELMRAREELTEAMEAEPDAVEIPHLLVEVCRALDDRAGAREAAARHLAAIRTVERREGTRAQNHLVQGAILEGEGDLEGALARYRRGLEEAPDSEPLLCVASAALAGLGRRTEARRLFAQLRETSGGSPAPLFLSTGLDLQSRGLPDAAARQFAMAAARTPDARRPVFYRALALLRAGRVGEAIEAAASLESGG